MSRRRIIRRQLPVQGGRTPHSAGFIRDLDAWVEREAAHFGVSRSFVIATCVGVVAGIEEQPDYRPQGKTAKLRIVSRR